MSSTRSIIAPPPFAANALTVIPPTPVAGVSYRDPAAGPASSPDGWPYAERVNSAEFNQIMFQMSSMLSIIDKKGVIGWSSAVEYTEAAVTIGSDGLFYSWLLASGPTNGGAKDPVSNPTYWKLVTSGQLLRTTMYINVGGVLQISVDGAAFTPAGSSIFAKHPLAAWADAEVQAGGGGGGSANSTAAAQAAAGSGGGGGGYARKRFPIATLNGQSISVGAGGAANIAGGSSSIGILVNCTGGGPGVVGANVTPDGRIYEGRPGGIGTGGDINAQGGFGYYSIIAPTAVSGKGGSSMFGDGAPPAVGTASVGSVGVNAVSYGSGGSGAANNASVPASRAGGIGMSGITIIREYA